MKKSYSYRLDEKKKQEFDEVCESLGINSSAAIGMFVSAVIARKRIPFDVADLKKGENN